MSQPDSQWEQKYISEYGEVSFKTLLKGNIDIAGKTAVPMILPLVGLTGAVMFTLGQLFGGGFTISQYVELTPKLIVNSLVPGLVYYIGNRHTKEPGTEGSEYEALREAQCWLVAAITFAGVSLAITLNTILVLTTVFLMNQANSLPTNLTSVAIVGSVLLIGVSAPVVVWKKVP